MTPNETAGGFYVLDRFLHAEMSWDAPSPC
jgi:hypothetical protein